MNWNERNFRLIQIFDVIFTDVGLNVGIVRNDQPMVDDDIDAQLRIEMARPDFDRMSPEELDQLIPDGERGNSSFY